MLSNIVLNELDHELERRGLRYCRWADDFVILVKSERAAKRVKVSVTGYLEAKLGLQVNKEKSKATPIKDVTFLGFQMLIGKIRVSNKARDKFKDKIRTLTRRNNPLSMYQIIQELNKYLLGWVGYFKILIEQALDAQPIEKVIHNRQRADSPGVQLKFFLVFTHYLQYSTVS